MSKREVLKKFGPELAGKRVGWVSVTENERSSDLIDVHIVTSNVARNGATYGTEKYTFQDGTVESGLFAEGFTAITGLSLYISRQSGLSQSGLYFSAEPSTSRGSNLATLGASGGAPGDVSKSERVWAGSGVELLDIVKNKMVDAGVGAVYPSLYYGLNARAVHADTLSRLNFDASEAESLLTPDSTMAEQTAIEIDKAASYEKRLFASRALDELMRSRLTVFSDVSSTAVPKIFAQARDDVATYEKEAHELATSMFDMGSVYRPVGFRPSGRTWPYMDPTASDADTAYGIELAALKNKNIAPASRELEREIHELQLRIEFAQKGRVALNALYQAETK